MKKLLLLLTLVPTLVARPCFADGAARPGAGTLADPIIVRTEDEHDRLPVGAYFLDQRPFGEGMLKQRVWPRDAWTRPSPWPVSAEPLEVRRAIPVRRPESEVRRATLVGNPQPEVRRAMPVR
jgi:hypothetical protein